MTVLQPIFLVLSISIPVTQPSSSSHLPTPYHIYVYIVDRLYIETRHCLQQVFASSRRARSKSVNQAWASPGALFRTLLATPRIRFFLPAGEPLSLHLSLPLSRSTRTEILDVAVADDSTAGPTPNATLLS